jgi:hypothetical protein
MEGAPLSLILDVVVLVLLGLTIVYAARLSLQLRRLRDSRSDLDKIVRDLVKNVDRADRAIAGLKEAARDSGVELQDAIDKALAISDELQLITDSGDRLASRLEALVDSARPTLNKGAAAAAPAAKPAETQASYAQHLRKLDAAEEKAAKTNFAIRDPDAERGIDPLQDKVALEDDGSGQGLYSEAERDLFRAMKGKARG